MALVVNRSKCAICGKELSEAKAASLPAFVRNTKDPLYAFSGRVFHADCFAMHPLRERAVAQSAERKAQMARPFFVCVVCGERIQSDGCTTNLLTTNPEHPLARFNYLHFHRSHFPEWRERAAFEIAIKEAASDGTWDGAPLTTLLV